MCTAERNYEDGIEISLCAHVAFDAFWDDARPLQNSSPPQTDSLPHGRSARRSASGLPPPGTMAAMGRVAGNYMSWVSIPNKKLTDRGMRLLRDLGNISYEEAAQRLFAAEEWIGSQDWSDSSGYTTFVI
jgi:hypothetical protein